MSKWNSSKQFAAGLGLCPGNKVSGAKAITASAHKLAVILYNMLKTSAECIESGARYYEAQYKDRCIRGLKRARLFGFILVSDVTN